MQEPTPGKKYVAEIVGTFILVWIGPGAATVAGLWGVGGLADVLAIAIAFGIAVAVAIHVVGKVSGCHINPAVTIALAATGKFPWKQVVPYMISQLTGAALASLAFVACLGTQAASKYNLGGTFLNDAAGVGMGAGFLGEAIGTFLLMLAIMGVAVDRRAPAGWAGWIIGMVVVAVIITLGPMTGASLNPARTFGPYLGNALFGGQNPWDQFLVVYSLGPIIGATIAAFLYNYVAEPEKD
jgi:glycerol uptake facilitator protein